MAQAPQKRTGSQPNKPVHVFRLKGVKVSIFENRADNGNVFYKAVLLKIYRDGTAWKTTSAVGRDDLPLAAMLLQDAYRWILAAAAARTQEESAA